MHSIIDNPCAFDQSLGYLYRSLRSSLKANARWLIDLESLIYRLNTTKKHRNFRNCDF